MIRCILSLSAAVFMLLGCASSQQANQETADQVFGKGKRLMVYANLTITTYNAACAIIAKTDSVCSPVYRELASSGGAAINNALIKAEAAYAATNTNDQAGRMAIAKAFLAGVEQLIADLAKYGIDRVSTQYQQQVASGDRT